MRGKWQVNVAGSVALNPSCVKPQKAFCGAYVTRLSFVSLILTSQTQTNDENFYFYLFILKNSHSIIINIFPQLSTHKSNFFFLLSIFG